jgi:hypothetical protein
MRRLIPFATASLLAIPLALVACGDDDDGPTSSGGSANKGGSGGFATTGGKNAGGTSTGGNAGHGGTTPEGGTSAKGGSPATGGASTGGTTPEGGTSAKGGSPATGGASTGGTATGGTATGGTATGGTATGGTIGEGGGMAEGGETAQGGNTAEGGGTSEGGAGAEAGAGGTTAEGGTNSGGAGGEPAITPDIVDNGDFETGTTNHVAPPGWTITGTSGAAFLNHKEPADQWHSHSGIGFLDAWLGTAYQSTISQIVSPLPEGNYSFSVWHYGGAYTTQYIYVKGYNEADLEEMTKLDVAATTTPPNNYGDAPLTVPTVHVTSGMIEIGIYLDCPEASCWTHFDDAVLSKVE